MSFRDDREALLERCTSLERELEATKRELSERAASAAKVASLSEDLMRMIAQRNELEQSVAGTVRRVAVGAVLVLGLLIGVVAVVEWARLGDDQDLSRCRARAEALDEDLRDAREALEAAEHPPPRASADPSGGAPSEIPIFSTLGAVASVVGGVDVGANDVCTIEVRYQPSSQDCHASIVCGMTDLYPRGGAGLLVCATRGGHIDTGQDPHASDVSDDPRLVLDVGAGTLTVSDVGPEWSVTVRFVPVDGP